MSLPKSLLLVIIGGIFSLGVLHFTLRSTTASESFAGCKPQAYSGIETVAIWRNNPVNPPLQIAEQLTQQERNVLGQTTSEKWIDVDLSEQRLRAYQGDTVVFEGLISSGLWNKTPSGTHYIWYKIKRTKMEGGSKLNKSYYYLPNVPYAMFFKGDYGIHGTYWHNNFGQRMSHGCVNTPTPLAEKLFYWSDPQLPKGKNEVRATPDNPGTKVIVHE